MSSNPAGGEGLKHVFRGSLWVVIGVFYGFIWVYMGPYGSSLVLPTCFMSIHAYSMGIDENKYHYT